MKVRFMASGDPNVVSGGADGQPSQPAPQEKHSRRRVMIVEDDALVGMGLRKQLERLGHSVVAHAASAGEAVVLFESTSPDIVLMDIRLDGSDGIELAARLLAKRRVPMIIISAFSDRTLIERAGEVGVFGYLIKPISGESLAAQMEVAARRFAEHEQLAEQNRQLTQTLENRKLVERAKGIFMKRLSLDENEAHRRLQQESQKRRINVVELARKIIESEEMLGG
jgi:two-component system, response regulator PdtaR